VVVVKLNVLNGMHLHPAANDGVVIEGARKWKQPDMVSRD